MTREEMLEFVGRILDQVPAPDVTALLTEVRNAAVRFGQNRITQNMDTFERTLTLTVGDGSRKAVLRTSRIGSDTAAEIAERAMRLLETAAEDPEYMPPVEGGQLYPIIDDYDEDTAAAAPEQRMRGAHSAIATAITGKLEASGYSGVKVETTALGSSTGNLAYNRRTACVFRLTLDEGRASSYRALSASSWNDLPVSETVEEVAGEVAMDRGQIELEPGDYALVLEPQAVGDLLPFIVWSMGARVADEGITVFSGREGSEVTGGKFSLSSEILGPVRGVPFNGEGLPSRDINWIENGVLRNLQCDRFWAKETGREALFSPGTFSVAGGQGTAMDLAGKVDRGLLIRRFWYIRFVDQKSNCLTGMTRDGVFLIENGKISAPVKDFRWNWKPLELFDDIVVLGECQRKGPFYVPSMLLGKRTSPFTR